MPLVPKLCDKITSNYTDEHQTQSHLVSQLSLQAAFYIIAVLGDTFQDFILIVQSVMVTNCEIRSETPPKHFQTWIFSCDKLEKMASKKNLRLPTRHCSRLHRQRVGSLPRKFHTRYFALPFACITRSSQFSCKILGNWSACVTESFPTTANTTTQYVLGRILAGSHLPLPCHAQAPSRGPSLREPYRKSRPSTENCGPRQTDSRVRSFSISMTWASRKHAQEWLPFLSLFRSNSSQLLEYIDLYKTYKNSPSPSL